LLEIYEQCLLAKTNIHFQEILSQPEVLTQFILGLTSFNLNNRIHFNDPVSQNIFKISRDLYFSIHNQIMKKLKEVSKKKTLVNVLLIPDIVMIGRSRFFLGMKLNGIWVKFEKSVIICEKLVEG
jgi:hypothetical protein